MRVAAAKAAENDKQACLLGECFFFGSGLAGVYTLKLLGQCFFFFGGGVLACERFTIYTLNL